MNYILFDSNARETLLPFTFTRPVSEIRVGFWTIRQQWEAYLEASVSSHTEEYLKSKYPEVVSDDNIVINASYLPTPELVDNIKTLKDKEAIFFDKEPIAFRLKQGEKLNWEEYKRIPYTEEVITIKNLYDIYLNNAAVIAKDFSKITANKVSQSISDTNGCIQKDQIFIEEGARVEFATLNASKGPIYIGKNAEVMEGSMIRGPFALCEGGVVKMGAKIYGGTTIGPYSKVGGEINNSVIFGYSNKGHDGFLGNSVIGSWCNIGADTNVSNLKNNYAPVRLWNYQKESFESTGLQFCGLMMGDHSKCGINTMFNTGTVVGVNANIFGSGFPRNFVPSYSWGGHKGFITYNTKKAFEVAKLMMSRRSVEFTEDDQRILKHVFELTKQWRKNS